MNFFLWPSSWKSVQGSLGQSPSMQQSGPAPNMRSPVKQGGFNGMKGMGGMMGRGGGMMGGGGAGGMMGGLEGMMGGLMSSFGGLSSMCAAPPGGNPLAGLSSLFGGLIPGMNMGGMPSQNARPPMASSNQQMPSNEEDEE